MKKVKQVIGTTLTASLATGLVGTVAGTVASAATIDEIYKAAYEATITALANKDQDSINAARVAINRLPSQFQGFIGEFSKQVDTVQHPILVKIVDAINNADKTGKQVDINAARVVIPAGLPDVWRNSYSSGLDGVQQKLITKAVNAAETAKTSGVKADIDAAKALINELALVEGNQGVKDWITTYDKEFVSSVPLTVDKVEAIANDTLKVTLLKEADASTVKTSAFSAYSTDDKLNVAILSATLSEDKKSVEIKLSENITESKGYTLDVKDLKDLNGNTIKSTSVAFEYAKADLASVTVTKEKIKVSEDLRKSVVVKDSLGRDITKDTTVTFESSNTGCVTTNGIAKAQGQVVVTPVIKDANGNVVLRGEKVAITVATAAATNYQGYSVYTLKSLDELDVEKLGSTYTGYDVAVDVKLNDTNVLKNKIAFFFTDQFGTELTANDTTTIEVLENMTPGVATLNTNREITTYGVGTAYFKVKVADVTKTISVNVTAEAKPTTITLDKASVIAAKKGVGDAVPQNITVSLKDQYAAEYKTGAFRYQIKNPQGVYVDITDPSVPAGDKYSTIAIDSTNLTDNGEAIITATPTTTVGKNYFKLIYERTVDGKVVDTIEKEFTVEVKEPGAVTAYEAKAVTSLDLYNDLLKYGDETKQTFKVYSLDSNGARVAPIDNATVTITDDKGAAVTTDTTLVPAGAAKFTVDIIAGDYTITTKPGDIDTRANATPTGNYTVTVKVGDFVANSYTLSVKDSMRTAEAVTFKSTTITAAEYGGAADKVIKSIVNLTDQYGKGIVLDNADTVKVMAADFTEINVVAGVSKDVVIKKVTVTFAGADAANQKNAVITLPTPVVITVVE